MIPSSTPRWLVLGLTLGRIAHAEPGWDSGARAEAEVAAFVERCAGPEDLEVAEHHETRRRGDALWVRARYKDDLLFWTLDRRRCTGAGLRRVAMMGLAIYGVHALVHGNRSNPSGAEWAALLEARGHPLADALPSWLVCALRPGKTLNYEPAYLGPYWSRLAPCAAPVEHAPARSAGAMRRDRLSPAEAAALGSRAELEDDVAAVAWGAARPLVVREVGDATIVRWRVTAGSDLDCLALRRGEAQTWLTCVQAHNPGQTVTWLGSLGRFEVLRVDEPFDDGANYGGQAIWFIDVARPALYSIGLGEEDSGPAMAYRYALRDDALVISNHFHTPRIDAILRVREIERAVGVLDRRAGAK